VSPPSEAEGDRAQKSAELRREIYRLEHAEDVARALMAYVEQNENGMKNKK
jgi:23S rRNA A2030 N6-methylase RlmJ